MRYLVYVQTSFAGHEVDDLVSGMVKSTELMYKYKGTCIASGDKGADLEFPTYTQASNFIRDNNEATNLRARKMTEQQMKEGF